VVHHEIRIELGAFFDGYCRPGFGKADGKARTLPKSAAPGGEARAPNGSTKAEVRPVP
jgi:hypothetical protein